MKEYRLIIASPEGGIFDGDVYQLSVRAIDGELAILSGHIPVMTAIVECECRIYMMDGSVKTAECGGGLLSVSKTETRLLSSSFHWKE